jgi:hypothetical protein
MPPFFLSILYPFITTDIYDYDIYISGVVYVYSLY